MIVSINFWLRRMSSLEASPVPPPVATELPNLLLKQPRGQGHQERIRLTSRIAAPVWPHDKHIQLEPNPGRKHNIQEGSEVFLDMMIQNPPHLIKFFKPHIIPCYFCRGTWKASGVPLFPGRAAVKGQAPPAGRRPLPVAAGWWWGKPGNFGSPSDLDNLGVKLWTHPHAQNVLTA